MINQTNKTKITANQASNASDSWATVVSQYLNTRQSHLTQAYQSQLSAPNDAHTIHDAASTDWVFAVLFEALVQRLKEGHTVITLAADNNDTHGASNWQQQLLQLLLPTLQPVLSNADAMNDSRILTNPSAWNALMQHFEGTQYQRAIIEQRYRVISKLYRYLTDRYRHYQQLTPDDPQQIIKNSLSDFITLIKNETLFQDSNNLSKIENPNATPIIYLDQNDRITLWLHRTWQAEFALAKNINRIASQSITALPIQDNPLLNEEQKNAITMANHHAFSIITGGPGTGKTFTVAQLVIALQQASNHQSNRADHMSRDGANDQRTATDNGLNLALAAPTGKAAQRMQESLQNAITQAGIDMQLPEAKTIHRLLGITQGGQPRYDNNNPLGEDIVIVDEASMLGVELATHLVCAIKPGARLILLGDANQLAAVDAGAVLADLCKIPALQDVHQRLNLSRRFDAESGIGRLAALTNAHNIDMRKLWQLIEEDNALDFYVLSRQHEETEQNNKVIKNSLSKLEFYQDIKGNYTSYFSSSKQYLPKLEKAKSMPTKKIFSKLLVALNRFKILTASHLGACGDHSINEFLSHEHRQYLKQPLSKSPWYHGRPIMVLQNNYELGLFNGDIGICIQNEMGQMQVFFEHKVQGIATHMFSEDMVTTAYAMTIHKSQGSEFEHVAICFDDTNMRLLSQELIYTAITRAKERVCIFSTPTALTRALNTPTVRQTGLAMQFDALD